ncbi:MAG: O-acetyl-ADP-ribose deacetylase [Candidatus Omnitrophica bacterium]|nr:O-acetyl-ADP-ribose deacetylase [Candidatus Omnitrophota bacterium]
MKIEVGRAVIELVQGDITEQDVDAIVNAANSGLMGGGGVDGAIHRAGGPKILAECRKIREKLPDGLPAGQAVMTTGGRLKARHVIHAVGPRWRGGTHGEPALLADCYTNSVKLADEKGLKSVSFPSISTGIYGYPVEKAAPVAMGAVKAFLKRAKCVAVVRFVLFDSGTYSAYAAVIAAPHSV